MGVKVTSTSCIKEFLQVTKYKYDNNENFRGLGIRKN